MSKIEWTEKTWNPVVGCTPVSPGCLNCYAATMAARLEAMGKPEYVGLTVKSTTVQHGDTPPEIHRQRYIGTVRTLEERLHEPLSWKKPRMIFVCSMSDLFHESVPFEFIDRVFAVMALTPQHTYQVLTKRPERMAKYMSEREISKAWMPSVRGGDGGSDLAKWKTPCDRVYTIARQLKGREAAPSLIWPLPNVWLGTSVEDQKRADERIPELLRCDAAVRFLSVEPLLGRVDLGLDAWWHEKYDGSKCASELPGSARISQLIQWVIVGGESGTHARPCNLRWIESIVRQCKDSDVPVFVKQMGKIVEMGIDQGVALIEAENGAPIRRARNIAVHPHKEETCFWRPNDSKGGDMAEWHEHLRVRQMPDRTRHGGKRQEAPVPDA